MAAALLPDRLWDLVEPFLPILPRRPQGGRPRVSDRACLTGIVFVLRSGILWQMLRQELGCGSRLTCWRRLRDWHRAGVWDLLHFALLDRLARSDQIDWSRAIVDSCSIRAVYGGDQTGPDPTDRAKRGSKRHLVCDGRGGPLAVRLTGANRNDSQEARGTTPWPSPLALEWKNRIHQRRLCGRGSRLRCRGNPIWVAISRHPAAIGDAPHEARQWFGSLTLGRRADICLAQSVSTPPCPVRQACRHPRSVPLGRLCADLLAVAAQDVEDRLSRSAFSGCHRQVAVRGSGARRGDAVRRSARNRRHGEPSRRDRNVTISS
jgi:transposase